MYVFVQCKDTVLCLNCCYCMVRGLLVRGNINEYYNEHQSLGQANLIPCFPSVTACTKILPPQLSLLCCQCDMPSYLHVIL